MALWRCVRCDTAFAVGLATCPNCGGKRHYEDGEPKPKPKPKKKP